MTQRSFSSRMIATGLILSLQVLFVPVFAGPGTATLTGSILSAGSDVPLAGAKLHAGDPKTGKIYSSEPAGADGAFTIENLPPATYEVAVESDGGLYIVQTPVKLAPGVTQNVNLAIHRQAAPNPDPDDDDGIGFWDNPLTAALIVLGAALVVGFAVDSWTDDDPVSPASPF